AARAPGRHTRDHTRGASPWDERRNWRRGKDVAAETRSGGRAARFFRDSPLIFLFQIVYFSIDAAPLVGHEFPGLRPFREKRCGRVSTHLIERHRYVMQPLGKTKEHGNDAFVLAGLNGAILRLIFKDRNSELSRSDNLRLEGRRCRRGSLSIRSGYELRERIDFVRF